MNIDIKSIEKEMGLTDEDNQLLVIYKGNDISSHITGMINRSGLTDKIVSRKVIVDTVGEYNMIYTVNTDIEKICNLLTRECMGYSINELINNQKKTELYNDQVEQKVSQ